MFLQFLGTSAGEQYPGFWCRCENCEKARQLGGRNIRKNSCAWISPNCLIDFSPQIFTQAGQFGIDIISARFLLVTHLHEDHFFPWMLGSRYRPLGANSSLDKSIISPRFSELEVLRIYGNNGVCAAVRKSVGASLAECALEVNVVEPFYQYDLGEMRIIPLLANHPSGTECGLNYIIEKDNKMIFYALDSGWFLPETEIEIKKYKFDLVVLESTFGYGGTAEKAHMNLAKVEEAYRLFRSRKLLKRNARFCASHICPHHTPVHDEIAPIMAKKGITIAYDGMRVEM